MAIPTECCLCLTDIEHSWHLFAACPFAIHSWNEARVAAPSGLYDTTAEWFLDLCVSTSIVDLVKTVVVFYTIWQQRNLLMWKGVVQQPAVCWMHNLSYYEEWKSCKSPAQSTVDTAPRPQARWCPPPSGSLKCNTDGAVFREQMSGGLGCVMRDSQGKGVAACSSKVVGITEPRMVEILAIMKALVWIANEGWERVIFESDAQGVVSSILNNNEDFSVFGCIVQDCRDILFSNLGFFVYFTPRLAIAAAHAMARQVGSLANDYFSFSELSWIGEAIVRDMAFEV